ncbi:MAG: hypothetical protein IKL10_06330 [Clostridia bacterium]|nr:hypothetical protein [Clostridia bacterium]
MKKLEDLDKNFKVKIPEFKGMKTYDIHKAPFHIYGLKYGKKGFYRMDTDIADSVSEGVAALNYNTSGGCVRFRTDSVKIILTATLPDVYYMDHMPLTGASSFDIYCDGEFCGVFRAPSVEKYKGTWSGELTLPQGEKDVLINFPLYNNVKEVYISLQENSSVKEGDNYDDKLPIVFYGSSITQGGCASHPGNSYPNMISRALSREILNLGFSGSCKAEKIMSDYIGKLPMSLFIYDYDHNAPTAEFLEDTHERFFKEIRALKPEVPIVMISVSDNVFGKENVKRRKEIIKRTYENAKATGDKNVYFLDGERFYDEIGLKNATVDGCHPNDLGFYAFYKNIEELIRKEKL